MATIFDLFEVTDISADTTYSIAEGNLLGVVDNVTSTALDDGEFDIGDNILIGGVSYNIGQIQEPSSSGRFTLGDGTNLSFNPASESDLSAVFLTVSNGGDVRYFIIPNDIYGDMNVAEIRTGSLNDVAGSDAATISTTDNNVNVVCFVSGTLIETPKGDVAVENINIGDSVVTHANGHQIVRWIISRELDFSSVSEKLKPIAFEKGSLGPDRPNSRLCVSPQHRMLVTTQQGIPVLVPAKALMARPGVRIMHGKRSVTYFHLVFSRHEIIRANGTLTESFFPGRMALNAIPGDCVAELESIFGNDFERKFDEEKMAAAPILRVQHAKRHALTFR